MRQARTVIGIVTAVLLSFAAHAPTSAETPRQSYLPLPQFVGVRPADRSSVNREDSRSAPRRLPPVEEEILQVAARNIQDEERPRRENQPKNAEPVADALPQIPRDFVPWWQEPATKPIERGRRPLPVDVNSLIVAALEYSPRVLALSGNAAIAETRVVETQADFDIRAFMESKFIRTSVPTGSILDAGTDVPRLREEDWTYSAGLRKKNELGGQLEVSQQIGLRDSNSRFFFPDNQGNARLTLSYNQPVLNGAGRAYNTSLIVLANIDTQIAWDRTLSELQDHLLQVTEAAWELYLRRTSLLQRERHAQRAFEILTRLEHRRVVDSLESQIARAKAAVASRRADLIRASTAIRNAEAKLRALVNAPHLLNGREAELVPAQSPSPDLVDIDIQDALVTALKNRPEIDAAMHEIKAASVRLDVAQNELLPVLDVVVETYVSGLRGDNSIGLSYIDQFSRGEPSYSAGFVFEVPLYRRAAFARESRRRLELRQLSQEFDAAVQSLNAEVEIAVREVSASYRELLAKFQAMLAAEADVRFLQRRWEAVPGEDRAASFVLADLLDAQDRLVNEEFGFVQAQVNYTINLTRFRRATGTLLQHERIGHQHVIQDGLPTIRFQPDAPAVPQ